MRQALAVEEPENFVRKKPESISSESSRRESVAHWYLSFGWWVHCNIERQLWFQSFVMVCIVLGEFFLFLYLFFGLIVAHLISLPVGISTGVSLNGWDSDPIVAAIIQPLSWTTLFVFILEIVVKITACGPRPLEYFRAPNGDGVFNTMDFVLTAGSVAVIGQDSEVAIKILRLIRLMRLLTFIKNVRELRVIVAGLIVGFQSVGYIVALLLLVIYL
jgi:hypothetical protein